ncbi:hypothetical protein BSK60_28590 [Paenibacillus odorifer]|uniref:Uncharacterized protein n=1 Tax=Paenibacillus odorifer TaxID=189426 RepID=A0AB36JBT4_9BACL|nr:hypothetical protein BSK60_28590 [Paenibacillus odorifer]OME13871.1 hypothetical protein BSK47_24800 [Paenibacillus odorifer]
MQNCLKRCDKKIINLLVEDDLYFQFIRKYFAIAFVLFREHQKQFQSLSNREVIKCDFHIAMYMSYELFYASYSHFSISVHK